MLMQTFFAGRNTGTILDAIARPLVDGKLWIPGRLPKLFPIAQGDLEAHLRALQPLFSEIDITEAAERAAIPVDITDLTPTDSVLELWHGPTRSFKDVGVRFASVLYRDLFPDARVVCATSGDTGAAVADAFGNRSTVVFPEGRISKSQEKQMRDTDAEVIAMKGDFDSCQASVKTWLRRDPCLLSANSISVARLLPQIAFHAWAASQRPGRVFVVPSGNLGNAYAAGLAKQMGAPIRQIHIATNANNAVSLAINQRRSLQHLGLPRAIKTLATAMDVQKPSNWPRLKSLRDFHELTASHVLDHEILKAQKKLAEMAYPVCPHTALAFSAATRMFQSAKIMVVGTACATKF